MRKQESQGKRESVTDIEVEILNDRERYMYTRRMREQYFDRKRGGEILTTMRKKTKN